MPSKFEWLERIPTSRTTCTETQITITATANRMTTVCHNGSQEIHEYNETHAEQRGEDFHSHDDADSRLSPRVVL